MIKASLCYIILIELKFVTQASTVKKITSCTIFAPSDSIHNIIITIVFNFFPCIFIFVNASLLYFFRVFGWKKKKSVLWSILFCRHIFDKYILSQKKFVRSNFSNFFFVDNFLNLKIFLCIFFYKKKFFQCFLNIFYGFFK